MTSETTTKLIETLTEVSSVSGQTLTEVKSLKETIEKHYATKLELKETESVLLKKLGRIKRGFSSKEWAGIITAIFTGAGAIIALIVA